MIDKSRITLVLASSSPRRRELIHYLNFPVEIRVGDTDESVDEHWKPERIVEELSLRKAEGALGHWDSQEARRRIVIGSDTIVVLDEEVLGKPRDADEACRMLRMLQGREHLVFTGAACLDAAIIDKPGVYSNDLVMPFGDIGQFHILSQSANGEATALVGHTVSRVTFNPMSDSEIEAYVATGEPLDKAGSYGVQGAGSVFIQRIEGDFYSVMGLPLSLLYRMLKGLGIDPLAL